MFALLLMIIGAYFSFLLSRSNSRIGLGISGQDLASQHRRGLPILLLPAIFSAIVCADFVYLIFSGRTTLINVSIYADQGDASTAAKLFFIYLSVFLLPLFFANWRISGAFRPAKRFHSEFNLRSVVIGLVVLLVIATGLYLYEYGLNFSVAHASAGKALTAAANPFLPSFAWALAFSCVALIGHGAVSLRHAVLLACAFLILLIPFGVRMHSILIVCALVFKCHACGLRIPAAVAFAAVFPGVALMTAYRYYFRASAWFSGSFKQFIEQNGGWFSAFFGSVEMSSAETFLLATSQDVGVERYPGESFVGLLMFPVPRQLAGEIKPIPVSSEFTARWAPELFFSSRSEVVVGGFANLAMEFGIIGGVVVVGLVSCVLAVTLTAVLTRASNQIFWGVALSFGILFFVRNEVYSVGTSLWGALIAFACIRAASVASTVFSLSPHAKRASPVKAVS